ncbi:lipid phosphate phosphatase 1 [Pluteus cervinus]|uniref:Lipid phosphate phosphatase 1 n=1 Tax=Pluteus cervinus TaxID=181527 RepID=A0ACD3AFF5_9AGAR|nr:lipid phosphate phosphatase 1 [Pluteus cervinus]
MVPLNRIREFFGQNSLDWFNIGYAFDWLSVLIIWAASQVAAIGPVYERDFSLDDPLISNPERHNRISSVLNSNVAFVVPIIVISLGGILRKSFIDIHHGVLVVCASRGLARLLTESIKHAVGRLRPDFLARCRWNEVLEACAGKASEVYKGRLSFPSGHSSTAFSGMTVLSLWWAGATAAWCFSVRNPPMPSRMTNFLLSLFPLLWATWVAITRIQDFRHHKEDIIVGSIIGILSATISYLMYWPSPFSARTFRHPTAMEPRYLYIPEAEGRRPRSMSTTDFEFSRLPEDDQVEAV